jgi:LacI family gluconate utilization system Gnt-I transcriptional repressor
MVDVAEAAGVSAQTVSRALRTPDSVTPETRKRVEEAIRKTKYVQNLAASHLASNRSMSVAAIVPTISASVFAETIQGLSGALLPHGYQIFLGATEYQMEREEALVRAFLGRRPDGFFVIGTGHTRAAAGLLKRAGVPVVESWEWTEKPIDLLVGFSNRAAIRVVVEHLVARGRRRLVFSGVMRRGDPRAIQRREGFVEAVTAHFPAEKPRLALIDAAPLAIRTGADALQLARSTYPDLDAVVFSSDLLAAGALLACGRQGIRVPDDLAITGFGDFEIASELSPALTTIAVPTRRIGSEAGRLLLQSMRGEAIDVPKLDLGFELKARESS